MGEGDEKERSSLLCCPVLTWEDVSSSVGLVLVSKSSFLGTLVSWEEEEGGKKDIILD